LLFASSFAPAVCRRCSLERLLKPSVLLCKTSDPFSS
jgi:hypothetical protein